jgi:hypothetical protein
MSLPAFQQVAQQTLDTNQQAQLQQAIVLDTHRWPSHRRAEIGAAILDSVVVFFLFFKVNAVSA